MEAYRRAVIGISEPVFFEGQECGRATRYSDALLIALMKRHLPEYKDTRRVHIARTSRGIQSDNKSVIESAVEIARMLKIGLSNKEAKN